mgnify:CR=1 FL=1|tara:strand:+ start:531 stop:740 length:210 start_codon:yes stop_codon:yes gene_type:complete
MENKIEFKSVKKLTNLGFDELEVVVEDINPIDGKPYDKRMSVPKDLANRHYAEIKRQVDAGKLTIEDAD